MPTTGINICALHLVTEVEAPRYNKGQGWLNNNFVLNIGFMEEFDKHIQGVFKD